MIYLEKSVLSNLYVADIAVINKHSIPVNQPSYFSNRKHYALVLKLQGRSFYKCKEDSYVSDAHHIIMISKGTTYEVKSEVFGEFIIIDFESIPEYHNEGIQSFYIKNNAAIQNLFINIDKEWTYRKFAYKKKCMSILYEIITLLEVNEICKYIDEDKMAMIRPAVEYIEKHYNDPRINVDILCSQANVSEAYFRKLFTAVYKMPPTRYIQTIRINKAKDLLNSNINSVGEIADLVGYSNIYYFSNAFKKETGFSPSEFARKLIL